MENLETKKGVVKLPKITAIELLLGLICCLLFGVLILLGQIFMTGKDILYAMPDSSTNAVEAAGGYANDPFGPTSELAQELKQTRQLVCEVANNTDRIGKDIYFTGGKRACTTFP
jgi:hypothetical protein